MKYSALALVGLALMPGTLVSAQVVEPEFAGNYSIVSLGSAPGVMPAYGGLMIRPSEPNTLYLFGGANGGAGSLNTVGLQRGQGGHITGWGCSETVTIATAPYNDGGLCMGPQGQICYATYPTHTIVQMLPGSSSPDKVIPLGPTTVPSSTGSILFVPPGFPGAGRLKILSYNAGTWSDATTVPAGDGTFDLGTIGAPIAIGGGPEGAIYVHAGNPNFTADSVVVSEYGNGRVVTYEVDGNGDPKVETRRVIVSGLGGAEGALADPVTGDFLFSTYGGGNAVFRLSGFTESQSCVGDLNGDGIVDGADLGSLLGNWGDCPHCSADLNSDCLVDGADLGILLGAWGTCH